MVRYKMKISIKLGKFSEVKDLLQILKDALNARFGRVLASFSGNFRLRQGTTNTADGLLSTSSFGFLKHFVTMPVRYQKTFFL